MSRRGRLKPACERTVGGMSRSAALVVAHLACYKGMQLPISFDEREGSSKQPQMQPAALRGVVFFWIFPHRDSPP